MKFLTLIRKFPAKFLDLEKVSSKVSRSSGEVSDEDSGKDLNKSSDQGLGKGSSSGSTELFNKFSPFSSGTAFRCKY